MEKNKRMREDEREQRKCFSRQDDLIEENREGEKNLLLV